MKISISLLLFAVAAIFYFKGFKELQTFNTELTRVNDSFAANFHAPIPEPKYQYSFLVSSFVGGIASGLMLSLAFNRIKISIKPEALTG